MSKSTVTQAAAVRLMLKFPYWSELYYTMTVFDDPNIPTLCTDGRNMWVNPTFWNSLTLEVKISALAHEVGHKMLLHCSRRGHRDPRMWNVAADYVVNGILAQNGFTLGDGWLFKDEYVGWSAEAVYADLMSKAKPRPQPGKGEGGQGEGEEGEAGEGAGGEAGDSSGDGGAAGNGGSGAGTARPPKHGSGHAQGGGRGNDKNDPGKGNSVTYDIPDVPAGWDKWQDVKDMQGSKEDVEKTEKEIMQSVEKAIQTARAHGSAPGGMKGYEDLMKPSKEAWYNHLHRYMQSLSMSEYNWARINRRQLVQHNMFTPDNYSEALNDVVFAIDCSGSVFNAASQAGFSGHVNAILAEAKPKRTHVVYFDSRITAHEELDYGALDFSSRPRGGGGTDFRPIFRFIEKEGILPEVMVILTDCYGDFPRDDPDYPVIWASIIDPATLGSYMPKFGEVIHVSDD